MKLWASGAKPERQKVYILQTLQKSNERDQGSLLQKHMNIIKHWGNLKNMCLKTFSKSSWCDVTYQNLRLSTWVRTPCELPTKKIYEKNHLHGQCHVLIRIFQHQGATQALSIWVKYFQYLANLTSARSSSNFILEHLKNCKPFSNCKGETSIL